MFKDKTLLITGGTGTAGIIITIIGIAGAYATATCIGVMATPTAMATGIGRATCIEAARAPHATEPASTAGSFISGGDMIKVGMRGQCQHRTFRQLRNLVT